MNLKSLTPTQMESAKTRAKNATKRTLGSRPERDHFRREHASLFDVLDIIASLIFVAAFAVSATHIIHLMDKQAAATYASTSSGVRVGIGLYTMLHQIGMLFLAELSAILFLVMCRLTSKQLERAIFGIMSLMAALFVFYANISSGLHLFIALLPPVFTLGIGFRLEQIIVEYLRRRAALDESYNAALSVYERAVNDITTHPDYLQMLRSQVWGELAKKNSLDPETPVSEKIQIVDAEIKRHDWNQEVQADVIPFGNAVPGSERVDHEFMTMNGHANGHGGDITIAKN